MKTLRLDPIRRFTGSIRLPGSKSISNRALLLASLATGTTELRNVLRAEDTDVMIEALGKLGVMLTADGDRISVTGRGGPLVTTPRDETLFLGLAGTAYRPLTAALCLGEGTFTLEGLPRMYERPIGPLVDALRALGADIRYLGQDGFPPLAIRGTGLAGGSITVPGDVSSQFLTSLLLVAPLARAPVTALVPGTQVSKPYLDLTLRMMADFGVTVACPTPGRYQIPRADYRTPGRYLVEGDASNATYFLAAAAIAGGPVRVEGIGKHSIQGDIAFLEVLERMGAFVTRAEESITVHAGTLRGVDLDLNHIPDAAMTVAVLALFAAGATTIRNIGNWRVKETDRLHAMATELRKLGATVTEGADSIGIEPPETFRFAAIDTYGDHRMAMCFSLVALSPAGITINDPGCVAKTYPEYFDDFAGLART